MSAENTVPIQYVPKDVDPLAYGLVKNPLKVAVQTRFDGNEIIFKEGEEKQYPLPVALHLAKHIAERMIIDEHYALIREESIKGNDPNKTPEVNKIEKPDPEKLRILKEEPIPEFKTRVFKKMEKICKPFNADGTKNKFFGGEDAEKISIR